MRSVSNINGFQNITDYKLSQVHEFAQENQFGCTLTTVNLIFLHLGQYWHLATQDKTHTHTHGGLCGAGCRHAYGPAEATATNSLWLK